MESYPADYDRHPIPVLGICGLDALAASNQNDSQSIRMTLVRDLEAKFTSRKNEYTLQESRHLSTMPFRFVLLPRDYAHSARSSRDDAAQARARHSPLSPLSPDSELYMDGIMTPAWVVKHMDTPSVIVEFYELWSQPSKPRQEIGPLSAQVFIDPIEREKDTALANNINERRKYFQDKGIKFAAVFVLDIRPSEDPTVAERLLHIKRQCGLDTKQSFFTIAPTNNKNELQEFENMLCRSMQEAALQYYANKIKKIRRKRSQLTSPLERTSESGDGQVLSTHGWMARYDFKAAFFSEARLDIEEAARTLESAYRLLSNILGPSSNRSKAPLQDRRLSETRALADSINRRLCRLYLFLNKPTEALAQVNMHLRTFQSLSSLWAAGEQSFEYWAWLSKRYELFADDVDAAIQAGFKIPQAPVPAVSPPPSSTASLLLGGGNETQSSATGVNPGLILQHPGFYYHLAAMCCSERRRRFIEANRQLGDAVTSPADHQLVAERNVDHFTLTIALLTKSYEQFKRFRNSRMTLYLAAEIAGTYYEGGKFELALKFFERIGKTYRKERWNMVLTSILRWSLRCAKELGSWERAVECLVELMAEDLPMSELKRADIQKELVETLGIQGPERRLLEINMDNINCFINCEVHFRQKTHYVDTPAIFQVSLTTGKTSPPIPLRLAALRVVFDDPQYNHYVSDAGNDSPTIDSNIVLLDVTKDVRRTVIEGEDWWSATADLWLTQNQTKALTCQLVPKACGHVKVVAAYIELVSPLARLSLYYPLDEQSDNSTPVIYRRWYEHSKDQVKSISLLGRTVRRTITPSRVALQWKHDTPAMLGEWLKVDVSIHNQEVETIDAYLRVEITPAEDHHEGDCVAAEIGDTSNNSVMEVKVGHIDPNAVGHSSLYLYGVNKPGLRLISWTVSYVFAGSDTTKDMVSKSETTSIPFQSPFQLQCELYSQHDRLSRQSLPDLAMSGQWMLVTAIQCQAPCDIVVKDVQLSMAPSPDANTSLTLASSIDTIDEKLWVPGHMYNANYLFNWVTQDLTDAPASVPIGTLRITWQRGQPDEELKWSITDLPLPSIPFARGFIVAADVPDTLYLGEPFTLTFTVMNTTPHLTEYSLSMEQSEAFVFSGYKQMRDRALPLSRMTYRYRCFPLTSGKVLLPRLKVMLRQQGKEREVPIEKADDASMWTFGPNGLARATEGSASFLSVFVNAKRHFQD